MKISFVGDVMLGRFVREKWLDKKYKLFSDDVLSYIGDSDYVIANLESPITGIESPNSLAFAGESRLLNQCKWVNCFSLSNNHINDFGAEGIKDTIENLYESGIEYNGIFVPHIKKYTPLLIENDDNKLAVVTATDMLNFEFQEDCLHIGQCVLTHQS